MEPIRSLCHSDSLKPTFAALSCLNFVQNGVIQNETKRQYQPRTYVWVIGIHPGAHPGSGTTNLLVANYQLTAGYQATNCIQWIINYALSMDSKTSQLTVVSSLAPVCLVGSDVRPRRSDKDFVYAKLEAALDGQVAMQRCVPATDELP